MDRGVARRSRAGRTGRTDRRRHARKTRRRTGSRRSDAATSAVTRVRRSRRARCPSCAYTSEAACEPGRPGALDQALRRRPRPGRGQHAAREARADVVGDHLRVRDAEDGPGPLGRLHEAGGRIDEASPAGQLAAGCDREAPIWRPPQVRRERPPVRDVGREPGQQAHRRPAAGGPSPDAQVRARRPVHPMLDRRAEVRREHRASHHRRLGRDRRRAATRRIDRAQSRPRAVVVADEDHAAHRPRREGLGRQVDPPRRATDDAQREPLARQRAGRVERGVQPEPGRVRRRRLRDDAAATGRRLPRRVRGSNHGRPARRRADPATRPRPGARAHARIGAPPRGPPPAG